MPTVRCFVCESERQLVATEQPFPLCSPACVEEFADTVNHLAAGGSLDEIGVAPGSLLARQAVDMVLTMRRADLIEAREWKEWEYERSRPRPMRPLYPC